MIKGYDDGMGMVFSALFFSLFFFGFMIGVVELL